MKVVQINVTDVQNLYGWVELLPKLVQHMCI